MIAVCGVLGAGSLAVLAGAPPAGALSLPSLTVSVPVTTPTVTVQTPPVPIKTPTVSVPLKAPPPPVKAPTVPVKAPTVTVPKVTVKAPTVTVKATTTVSSSPSVSVKASPSSGRSPSVSVGASSGSPVTVKASWTPAKSSATGAIAPSRSTPSRSGSAGVAGANKSSSGSAGAGATYGLDAVGGYGLGPGYGELPALAGGLSARVRAHIARRERSLKATVAQLHGCLSSLPASQQRLLELRTGIGAKPLGPRAAAARLHVGPQRLAGLERRAVRELRASASAHGCNQSASQVVSGVMSFIGGAFGAGPGDPHAKLAPASYSLDPSSLRAFLPHAKGSDDGLLGAAISPAATDALLALLLVLAAGVLLAVVVVGASGRGPRDPEWRRRAAARLRAFH
jgi:hypothetical protein